MRVRREERVDKGVRWVRAGARNDEKDDKEEGRMRVREE